MAGKVGGIRRKRIKLPKAARAGWMSRQDNRERDARERNAHYVSIATDLGGIENLSMLKRSLLERFIHAQAIVAQIEGDMRECRSVDIAHYVMVTDRVIRLAQALGLDRVAKRVPRALDYAAANAAGNAP